MAQLYYKYGTMNSGKTIEILKVAHNYEEQGKERRHHDLGNRYTRWSRSSF